MLILLPYWPTITTTSPNCVQCYGYGIGIKLVYVHLAYPNGEHKIRPAAQWTIDMGKSVGVRVVITHIFGYPIWQGPPPSITVSLGSTTMGMAIEVRLVYANPFTPLINQHYQYQRHQVPLPWV